MGTLAIPLAASGGAAPVTLVEILTGYIPPPGPTSPTGITFPTPPFAVGAGQSVAWALATQCGATGSIPIGGSSSANLTTGALAMPYGAPLTTNQVFAQWWDFKMPTDVPAGATIVAIYPVAVLSAFNPGPLTQIWTAVGILGSPSVIGAGVNTGGSVGTSLAGKFIYAEIQNSLPGPSVPPPEMVISFIGFGVVYTSPPPGMAAGEGDAESALSVGTYFLSEHRAEWPSLITGQDELYLDWLTEAQVFRFFGSTQTDTATITIQNVSGNTVERDATKIFTRTELIGALLVARIWRGDAMTALLTFIGNITEADIDDAQMVLTVEGFGNYSAVLAPAYNIDKSCPLNFGSIACGSTSPTPCDQSYGGCSSINRFAGVVTQWDEECPNVQMAQPPPAVIRNPARAF